MMAPRKAPPDTLQIDNKTVPERQMRRFLRDLLRAQIPGWAPLYVRIDHGGAGRYWLSRHSDPAPENPALEFSLNDNVPPGARRLVATLIALLAEQAAMANLAMQSARWELAADGRRKVAGEKTAAALKRDAAANDTRLRDAALRIRKDQPRIKNAALAAMLADQGHGGSEAIRKKLPRLLPPKRSVETR